MDNSFRARVFPWFVRVGVAFTLCAAFGGLVAAEAELRRGAEVPLPALPPAVEAALKARVATKAAAQPLAAVTLRRGETFSDALVDLGLDSGDAQQAVSAALRYVDPRSLQPGDRFLAFGPRNGAPASIHVALASRGELRLLRQGGSWATTWRASERSIKVRTVSAVLTGTLDGSIRAAGGPASLAYRMSDVLQWDLDFNRDLQPGDRFSVLFEDVFLDGVAIGPGRILAMRYETGGRALQAYRYGAADDYYDESGKPLKKMFLKSPLPYSRVTSSFSTQRFHPILKRIVPHWGIDLGAPVGTPVRATGSGVVLSAGWEGGGGKAIRIRHPNGYISGYLHLSGYAPAVRAGARVAQGDVIGYVGQTGLATGPHLDYRVQLNGTWLNPMSLKGVESPVIAPKELERFRSWRDALRASLDGAKPLPELPSLSPAGTEVVASQPLRSVTAAATAARR